MSIGRDHEGDKILGALLREIIPGNPKKGIPSAGDGGILNRIRSTLDNEKDLTSNLRTAIGQFTEEEPDEEAKTKSLNAVDLLEYLEREHRPLFSKLIRLTYTAYYTVPEITVSFGLSGRPPHPHGYDVPEESDQEIAELTAPVKRLGRRWVEC